MNRRWRNLVFPRKRRFDPPWAAVAATPPTFSPAKIDPAGARPRWTSLPRRGRFQAVVPTPVVIAAPSFVPNFTAPALRQRSARARRGAFPIVPASTGTTFALIEPSGSRPKWSAVRRGRFLSVPTVPPVVAALLVPRFIQQAGPRIRPAAPRRGQFQPPSPSAALSAFVEPSRPRPRATIARRGRFWAVPPAVVTTGTGPVVSPYIEPAGPRAPTYVPRRGSFYRVPLVGLAPAAPASPPGLLVSNRPTPVPTRRGLTRWVPLAVLGVPDQISPTRTSRIQQPRHGTVRWAPTALPAVSTSWLPDQISPARVPARTTRRGRLLWTPSAQPSMTSPLVPDQINPSRSTRGILTRRGRYWVLVSQPATSAPPSFVHRIRSRRPITLPVRRGTILDNWAASTRPPVFVGQDLAATVTITAYSAAATTNALAATAAVDALGAAVIVDA